MKLNQDTKTQLKNLGKDVLQCFSSARSPNEIHLCLNTRVEKVPVWKLLPIESAKNLILEMRNIEDGHIPTEMKTSAKKELFSTTYLPLCHGTTTKHLTHILKGGFQTRFDRGDIYHQLDSDDDAEEASFIDRVYFGVGTEEGFDNCLSAAYHAAGREGKSTKPVLILIKPNRNQWKTLDIVADEDIQRSKEWKASALDSADFISSIAIRGSLPHSFIKDPDFDTIILPRKYRDGLEEEICRHPYLVDKHHCESMFSGILQEAETYID